MAVNYFFAAPQSSTKPAVAADGFFMINHKGIEHKKH